MRRARRIWQGVWFLLLAGWHAWTAAGVEVGTLQVAAGDTDIPVTRYAAPGQALVLWLPSEFGVLAAEHIAARHLAEKGYETWIADLYGARFLPVLPSSAEQLPAMDVVRLIREASRQTHKRVYLVTAGRGAKYALEGGRLWREQGRSGVLAGAILLYPNLYQKQPEPGEDPTYLPIAAETRLPIAILQGELSPWYWTLDTLQAQLARGGSTVSVTSLAGVRDRFYFRDGATPLERASGERLPELIAGEIRRLEGTPRRPK
jgi:hypothetical protein